MAGAGEIGPVCEACGGRGWHRFLLGRKWAVDVLVGQASKAVLDAWNKAWNTNPDVMTQAGESFKRRFYVETIIGFLRSLPVDERMEVMGMVEVDRAWWSPEGLTMGLTGVSRRRPDEKAIWREADHE